MSDHTIVIIWVMKILFVQFCVFLPPHFKQRGGKIKDRNSMDFIEAEDIKRWQEYTELYKKDINDLDNLDGMITHLQPDPGV